MNKILLGLAATLTSANLSALPVTIDADDYAIGSNVTTTNNGVTLQAITRTADGMLASKDVSIAQARTTSVDFEPATGFGENQFGYTTSAGTLVGGFMGVSPFDFFYGPNAKYTGLHALKISFFDPVQYISVKALSFHDPLAIRAYDVSGNLLLSALDGFSLQKDCHCIVDTLEIQRTQADISYVIVGGSQTSGQINEITYDVPAPSSVALMLFGLAGGIVSRKRGKFYATK